MNKFVLRNFLKKDISSCARIINRTLGKTDAGFAKIDFCEGINPKTGEYVFLKRKVVVSNGKIIGIGGIYRLDTHPKNISGICWFAVHPDYQDKGVGTKLMNWQIAEAKKHKDKLLFVWAIRKVVPFYKRFGFKKSHMKIRPRESKILLVKELHNH